MTFGCQWQMDYTMAFTSSNGKIQTSLAEINVVPLVDVVLVLLIIFMLTAPIIQSGIEINVPKTRTVKSLTQERLVIQITRDQVLYLNDTPININEFETRLKSRIKSPSQGIYLRADEEVPFGTIAKVMDRAKQAGLENISIVTQPLHAEKK
jgi:biopolymer transport protein ExbD/biopolymer transport protein TolR